MNLTQTRVVSCLLRALAEGGLESVMVEPVCATFSLMRTPPLRSQERALGCDPTCWDLAGVESFDIASDCMEAFCVRHWRAATTMRFLPSWSQSHGLVGVTFFLGAVGRHMIGPARRGA